MRRLLAGTLSLIIAGGLVVTEPEPAAAHAFPSGVWTESAYTSVFRDSLPSADAGTTVRLDTGRNEFEAGQVVIRRLDSYTINAVTFTGLASGPNSIAAGNLSYNFVEYENLNHNSRNVYPLIRYGAGEYPDRLINQRTKSVPARTTQSIWVRVFVPASTVAGTYTGTVRVETDKGTFPIPISVAVRNVLLPESKDGSFTSTLWQLFTGPISWDEGAGDSVNIFWGFDRYSPQWWTLMEDVARMMRQYRTNDFAIPIVRHLMDAGSRQNADGSFTFNWSRFDQVVEFMMARGVVKRLEGFWMGGPTPHNGGAWNIETIDTAGRRLWVPWNSTAGANWTNRFIPALREHIRSKGWEPIFWTHVGDEPAPGDIPQWRGHADRIRANWPGIKIGDAVVHIESHQQIIDHTDIMIPLHDTYDRNAAYYDQKRAEGKELWIYNCVVPQGNYLNRFVDQPQWNQRVTMWHAYSRGVTGYLHWAMGNWQYPMNDQPVKGDGVIVRPDRDRGTVEVSTRYESLRDGIEDYEVLNVLGRTNPGLARGLAGSLAQRGDKYTTDTAYMQRIRALALDAAAGLPINPDLARGTAATGSSGTPANAVDGNSGTGWQPGSGTQWIRLDLGRQVQLDGIRLNWGSGGGNYKLQISYDGTRWTDAYSTTTGDGGTDFVGLNSKARYLRLETTTSGSLNDFQVAGFVLAKANLAGGRTYTRSPEPNNRGDSGIESTDGFLADAWDDERSYGYQAGVSTVEVTMDLGSVQLIDSARLHAYEEYPAYRPSSVRVATSTDGVNFTQRGHQFTPRGPSGIWYSFNFTPVQARHVKVTFTKTYDADATAMFIDEIEVYSAIGQNHAGGRPYSKSRPAPTDPNYPDTGDRESTDGILAGGYGDGRGYGYYLPTPGQMIVLDLLLDLGAARSLSQVKVAKYNDGVHDYGPGNVKVFTGNDPVSLPLRRETSTANGNWFELPVTDTGRYVRVQVTKTRTHDFADYLFVDEIQALDTAGTNHAAARPYTKSHPAPPDPNYPDTGERESTDNSIAGGYGDGLGYGYHLPVPGQTVVLDVLVDLGTSRALNLLKVQQFDDAVHHYDPDTLRVFTGDSPVGMTLRSETWTPSEQWYDLPLGGATARYLKVQITKTRVHDFGDYLFLDELTVS